MIKHGMLNNSGYLFKNIWKHNKLQFVLTFVSIPVAIFLPYLQAILPKTVIEGLQQQLAMPEYLKQVCLIGLALAAAKVLNELLTFVMQTQAQNMRGFYSQESVRTSAKMDYEILATKSTLEKMNMAFTATLGDQAITAQFAVIVSNFLISLFGMIAFAPFIIQIQPILLLLIFISFAVNFLYGIFIVRHEEKTIDAAKPFNQKLGYISDKAANYKYAKDVRLYKLIDMFFKSYKTFNDERQRLEKKLANVRFLGDLIAALFVFLRDGLAYFYLITLAIAGKIPIAEFVFLFPIITGFSDWLMSISTQITNLLDGCLKMDYFRDYGDLALVQMHGTKDTLPSSFDITLKNVSYTYNGAKKPTIHSMNLHIKEHEKLAIVGINGAGKTTLTNLIMNFFHPTEGEILIGGENIKDFSMAAVQKMFGAVFQDIFIPPETVKNIIACSVSNCDEAKFQEAIRDAGFEKTVSALPQKENTYLVKSTREGAIDLSGGQQQRLMLARVLYKDAPILILDEPTAALDPIAESEIYENYNEMTKNKTSIFISHRLASTKFCDRIILLDGGNIIEEGTHDELMKAGGKYKEMFDVQAKYYQESNF